MSSAPGDTSALVPVHTYPFEAMAALMYAPGEPIYPHQRRESNLGQLLGYFEQHLQQNELGGARWLPARIIAGCVNYKINQPDAGGHLNRVIEATRQATAYYAGRFDHLAFSGFAARLGSDDALMRSNVPRVLDSATMNAANPTLCLDMTRRVIDHVGPGGKVFIALGSGGILPCIQADIYHQAATGTESVVYPVRFSTNKLKDREPRLSPEEVVYLQRLASEGFEPVIIDDDVANGNTMQNARKFFGEVFDHRPPGFVSYDVSNRGLTPFLPPRLIFTSKW